jgi:L-seryl-tRNA(Ser) seleniumtransferase
MSGSTDSQAGFLSRRRFFRWASSLAAVLGAAPLVSSAQALSSPTPKLEVRTIIGTYTTLTAACMPPEVLAAVQKAALHPVRLHDLQRKAGEYIARRLRCEGAVVTSGAAGAISLATAACLQYANNADISDIPQALDGKKNQVIVQHAHRYEYDRAMYLCGARVTEVVTLDDYKRACGAGNAVMTNFFNAAEEEDGIAASAQIGREEWLRVAHEYKIPYHLDAAADMPPISNLWKYTGMGFDLVAFSGGKGMRGPQNAGLLLGRKVLTDLAHENNNPGDGIGRGHEGGEGTDCGHGCCG